MIALFLAAALASPTDAMVRPDALPAWASPSGAQRVETEWWTTFGDPGLAQIMGAALESNSDLKSAFARTRAARSQARASRSALMPTLSFDSTAQLSPTASRGFQFGGFGSIPGAPEPPKTFWTGQAALNAGWELDVFLRNQQSMVASRHDALAAEGDRDAAVLAFATRVAEGYFDVIAARQRLELAKSQNASAESLLEIVELRYQAGDAASVDLLQQRQSAARTRSQVPLAEANVEALQFQLAVALALPPATKVPGVASVLPELPPMPDAGVPADLIGNRPDLMAAEERVVAAGARKRNTVRQLLPTVRLSAVAGWQFFNETEFTSQTFWNAGGSVSIPLFNGGRTQHGIQAARSNEHAAVHAYTQLAANAVLEVESALVQERTRTQHLEAVQEQLQASRLALDEAKNQYVRGVGSYLTLLTAQTTRDTAELALLDSHRQLLSARIQLHDALGGAWVQATADTLGERP